MAAELVALTEELQRPLSSRGRLTDLLDPFIDLTEQILVLVFRVTHFTDAPGSLVATITRWPSVAPNFQIHADVP